jgi:hypothetical protein
MVLTFAFANSSASAAGPEVTPNAQQCGTNVSNTVPPKTVQLCITPSVDVASSTVSVDVEGSGSPTALMSAYVTTAGYSGSRSMISSSSTAGTWNYSYVFSFQTATNGAGNVKFTGGPSDDEFDVSVDFAWSFPTTPPSSSVTPTPTPTSGRDERTGDI